MLPNRNHLSVPIFHCNLSQSLSTNRSPHQSPNHLFPHSHYTALHTKQSKATTTRARVYTTAKPICSILLRSILYPLVVEVVSIRLLLPVRSALQPELLCGWCREPYQPAPDVAWPSAAFQSRRPGGIPDNLRGKAWRHHSIHHHASLSPEPRWTWYSAWSWSGWRGVL